MKFCVRVELLWLILIIAACVLAIPKDTKNKNGTQTTIAVEAHRGKGHGANFGSQGGQKGLKKMGGGSGGGGGVGGVQTKRSGAKNGGGRKKHAGQGGMGMPMNDYSLSTMADYGTNGGAGQGKNNRKRNNPNGRRNGKRGQGKSNRNRGQGGGKKGQGGPTYDAYGDVEYGTQNSGGSYQDYGSSGSGSNSYADEAVMKESIHKKGDKYDIKKGKKNKSKDKNESGVKKGTKSKPEMNVDNDPETPPESADASEMPSEE